MDDFITERKRGDQLPDSILIEAFCKENIPGPDSPATRLVDGRDLGA